MNKKQYIFPLTEVMNLGSELMQHAFGPASGPGHMGAPINPRRTEVF